jgi:hypothetical protein
MGECRCNNSLHMPYDHSCSNSIKKENTNKSPLTSEPNQMRMHFITIVPTENSVFLYLQGFTYNYQLL